MLMRIQGERNPFTLLVGVYISVATMETSMNILQKPKNRAMIDPWYILEAIKVNVL